MYIFCYKSRVKAEFDSLGHKRQNMWLQKADERTLRMTGLQHDAANIYIGACTCLTERDSASLLSHSVSLIDVFGNIDNNNQFRSDICIAKYRFM